MTERPDPLQLDATGEPLVEAEWYWRGFQAGIDSKPAGLLYWLLGFALAAGVVVGYVFGAMSVAAAPDTGTAAPLELVGIATWYCGDRCTRGYGPSDLVAAAGSDVRRALGAGWRGTTVTACASRRCVDVELVDWCACEARRGVSTLLDLSSGAFRRLAPLSAGVVEVRVLIGPGPTLPPTSR